MRFYARSKHAGVEDGIGDIFEYDLILWYLFNHAAPGHPAAGAAEQGTENDDRGIFSFCRHQVLVE